MQKWECHVRRLDSNGDYSDALNRAGENGWEVVGVMQEFWAPSEETHSYPCRGLTVIFKRRKA